MGFFSKLFKKDKVKITEENHKTISHPKENLIGKTDVCPYCNKKLETVPSKKKKCKDCGQFIYVRTRPQDRKKVLVTEKEKDLIEEQWQQHFQENEDKEILQTPEFENAKKELSKQFGKEASIGDAKWRVYNQRILEFASKKQWGLYRNNKLDMSKLLIREGHHKQALITLYEICYLDLNGCNNVGGGISEKDMSELSIHEFDPKMAFLAPGILSMIDDEIEALKIDKAEAKKLFIENNDKTKPKKNMPLSSEDAWSKLNEQMAKNKKIQSIDPNDIDGTFKEINELIKKKEFSDASTLITKIKSLFYAKKQDKPDVDRIKKYLSNLLKSKESIIVNSAESLLLTMAKKDLNSVTDLMEDYVQKIKDNIQNHAESNIVGELASINVEWVKPMIPKLIKNLKDHPEWNGRRFSAFNLGSISAKNPELVEDAIPIMIEYIKKPFEVTKRYPITVKAKGYTVSLDLSAEKMLGVDQTQWLKDAYIDSIGMIAKGDKKLILKYKSLFEDIARKDKSVYSRKKAEKVLDILK